ncbi:alpha/beta-hydrolase, partial [Wilcoxina mikolae CBS 423.85]
LLERGVSTLIYNGDLDSAVPSAGMKRALERLEWSGGNRWRKRSMRDWWYGKQTKKQKGGSIKGGDGLWWVQIRGAGHMVPADRPEAAVRMLEWWLSGGEIL